MRNTISASPQSVEIEEKVILINREIATIKADELFEEIVQHFKPLAEEPDQINRKQMWKVFNRLWPKHQAPVSKNTLMEK